jgi:hypothetical protein
MRPQTCEELIARLYSDAEETVRLNRPAGAVLLTLATALETGVETELAALCLQFAEEQRDKVVQTTGN